jgi:1-acyl-sn-glycerol-3-phosphate acyltransferase
MKEEVRKTGFFYRIIKWIISFTFNNLMFRHVYYMNTKNVPPDGTPLVIVENHQNCLIDAIAVLLSNSNSNRKIHFIARADIFSVSGILTKFMRYLGVMPAYRANFEGIEAVGKNEKTFAESEELVAGGEAVMLFPEAGHQNKRWLGDFTSGYTTLAFNAAKKSDFLEEVFILPCANHYSRYYPIQGDMLIKYGKPISLKPYYELYKSQPRTAQREVNELVRAQIKEMMLNIEDLDNYDAIDFLRTNFGANYAHQNNLDYKELPEQLIADKQMVEAIGNLPAVGIKNKIFDEAQELKKGLEENEISFKTLTNVPLENGKKIFGMDAVKCRMIVRCVCLVLLLPLWIFSLWPAYFIYVIPQPFAKRMNDPMLRGSFLLGFSAIITIPLFYLISFLLACKIFTVLMGVIYVCLLPLLSLFAWYYCSYSFGLKEEYRFYKNRKSAKLRALKDLRDRLEDELWSALK